MRILVTGSKDWGEPDADKAFDTIREQLNKLPLGVQIECGALPGAEAMTASAAKTGLFGPRVHKTDKRKPLGPQIQKRNERMLRGEIDAVLVFGRSLDELPPSAQTLVRGAAQKGVAVNLVTIDGAVEALYTK